MVRLAKPFFLTVLAVALAAYVFDCEAATTPEQAMDCCRSMPCSSHGHDAQDCCKAMQAMHAPFVQPTSAQGVSYSPVVGAVVPTTGKSLALGSPDRVVATHCHAPPIRYGPVP